MTIDKSAKNLSRRQFLMTTGAASVCTLLNGNAHAQDVSPKPPEQNSSDVKVPTRPFGKSGRQVSILSLGGMFSTYANQLMLRQAVKWGVTYWDTANIYEGGNSELGFGKYFARYPEDREKIFLVTKAKADKVWDLNSTLDLSLERMQTSYIDLFFMHGLRKSSFLTDKVRKWAEKAKAEKKIRLFGFSTHNNMASLLKDAARLGWIDGIMMTYNFRNMNSPGMKEAVDACIRAGIGLTAMKTQASTSWYEWSQSTPEGKALAESFRQKGWTEEQAKLKAVWQNPHIASICSQMDSMRLLKANVDAAVDPTALSTKEAELMQRYACITSSQYCTGCGQICEGVLSAQVPISNIMRYHMYCRGYGRPDWAREKFAALPHSLREQMAHIDYSEAEARCPQRMPIARLMHEALEFYA